MKNILLPFLFLILLGCNNSIEEPGVRIFGEWEYNPGLVDDFMGQTFGDEKRRKYNFYRPHYCAKYTYDDHNGYRTSFDYDSLTFYINDERLYIYNEDGSLRQEYKILKLNEGKLKLKTPGDFIYKYKKQD